MFKMLLTYDIIYEEVIKYCGIYTFMSLCQTCHDLYHNLMNNEKLWNKLYIHYYNDSGMKSELNKSYYDTFKMCWGLKSVVYFSCHTVTIKAVYLKSYIECQYTNDKRFLYGLSCIKKLKSIIFYYDDINTIKIDDYIKQLPHVTNIEFEKNEDLHD